ncbi:hypothetical protein JXB27_03765 [Candidatus Woesearchaeota archaeon]|nr:hypothetical protein [Candidatus Woesearchaeota archaeon]
MQTKVALNVPVGFYEWRDIVEVVNFAEKYPEIKMKLVSDFGKSCPLEDLLEMMIFQAHLPYKGGKVYIEFSIGEKKETDYLKEKLEGIYTRLNSEKELRIQRALEADRERARKEEKRRNSFTYKTIEYIKHLFRRK